MDITYVIYITRYAYFCFNISAGLLVCKSVCIKVVAPDRIPVNSKESVNMFDNYGLKCMRKVLR